MTVEEIQIRWLLYNCIQELDYIQCVESPGDHSLCATSKGRELINSGMKALGIKDLSADTVPRFLAATGYNLERGAEG